MNIQQAKEQIRRTVEIYLMKDPAGRYRIPVERQRPIFLIGAPGIGKTAIMAQIAREMDIGLVSYSMTHHTRQSALGLPFITKKNYGGELYEVSEYTMSEIIASVYECMEKSGKNEGILFLDEINCVSETLGPSMLQFLQYKTFGRHRVPDGWVVVTAGNPPEYNRSVHEFDIATLDRLKVIEAEPDYDTWKKYAASAGVHRAIRTYLDLKPEDFYSIKTTMEGKNYVTARGWEDLSDAMYLYEEKNFTVDETLIGQYIRNSVIAAGFASFYQLFRKYRNEYRVADIVRRWEEPDGPDAHTAKELVLRAKKAPFDERVTLMGLLTESLLPEIRGEVIEENCLVALHERLAALKIKLSGKDGPGDDADSRGKQDSGKNNFASPAYAVRLLTRDVAEMKRNIVMAEAAGGVSDDKMTALQYPIAFEENCIRLIRQLPASGTSGSAAGGKTGADAGRGTGGPLTAFDVIRQLYASRVRAMQDDAARINREISHVFRFTDQAFGSGSEMLLLVTEFTVNSYSSEFLSRHDNEEYYTYNRQFLLSEREAEIDKKLGE